MADPEPLDPDTDAAVLAAARQLYAGLWGKSWMGVGLHAIAERAGVDFERLYHRCPRPEWLLAEALGRAADIADIPDLGDTRAELSMAAGLMIGDYTERPAAERALLTLALTANLNDEEVFARVRELAEQPWRGKVVAALRRAAARGDLPPDADVELVVDVWAGVIAYRRALRRGPLDADFGLVLVDLMLAGMVPLRRPEPLEPWPADAWPEPLTDALNWLYLSRPGRTLRTADGVPVENLAQAPEHHTTIDPYGIRVSASLCRDFMPGVTEDSTRMTAIVTVAADGAGILPPYLRADRIVMLHGDEAWVAVLEEEYLQARTSRQFQVVARLGPKWPPGEAVDVVVRLAAPNGTFRLVRISGLRIERSE